MISYRENATKDCWGVGVEVFIFLKLGGQFKGFTEEVTFGPE